MKEKVDKLDIKNEKQATDIYDQIQKSKFKVGKITKKEAKRNPTMLLPLLPYKLSLAEN